MFEIATFIDEDGNDQKVRMFHRVFSTSTKAEKYRAYLEQLPHNEGIEFDIESDEVDQSY